MLNLTENGDVIQTLAPGTQFKLPNGDVVSPAYVGWASGAFALVEAPPQPEPEPPVPDLSFAQLMIGLVAEGWITTAEGEAWLTGTLPAPVLALIGTLPEAQRFAAKARALRPTIVERTDPLVSALGAAQGKTPEQLDDFFRTYALV
jgi:hypothetical protein